MNSNVMLIQVHSEFRGMDTTWGMDTTIANILCVICNAVTSYGQFQDQGPNSNFDIFLVVLQKCERPVELLVLQVIKLH